MTTLVANTFAWPFRWLRILAVKAQAAKAARATVAELRALTDYELNDIGISRGQIRHLAQEHYDEIVNANLKGWV
tara:strand:+ start:9809 stop:10033 length:225 start_codon:yes stop_codon:yes gene_type:complete